MSLGIAPAWTLRPLPDWESGRYTIRVNALLKKERPEKHDVTLPLDPNAQKGVINHGPLSQ
jgi:hypothetical protein